MDVELPFSGLKVIDLSQGIAGPYCTQILWQQGAEVIKVEPFIGDWGRHVGAVKNSHSAVSISYNAGKKSIAIDAKKVTGQKLIKNLIATADIVVQNFRPGVVKRLGLDYESVCDLNPTLIYLSISGYGEEGPYAQSPASDSVMQADSGLMFTNREKDGEPKRIGMLLADIATALYASQITAVALYQRLKSNKGAHLKLNLLQACSALQINDIASVAIEGIKPKEAVSAPNGVFECADGPITVLALNNSQFNRLCKALEKEEWIKDARFKDNASRMRNKEYLHQELAVILKQKNRSFWEERFKKNSVLHAPVRDYDSLLKHPQVLQQGLFQNVMQPGIGNLSLPGIPGPKEMRRSLAEAPAIGEHTKEILLKNGIEHKEYEKLIREDIVRQAS